MKRLITSLIALLILGSCDNHDSNSQNPVDQLPPATQTGENTFGCLVDGVPITINNSSSITAIYQGGFIQFGAAGIYILVLDPFSINTPYPFQSTEGASSKVRFTGDEDGPALCYYNYENTYQGHVRFTKIDEVNYIVSGTFEFSTALDGCDTLRVTNGRFDVQYIP